MERQTIYRTYIRNIYYRYDIANTSSILQSKCMIWGRIIGMERQTAPSFVTRRPSSSCWSLPVSYTLLSLRFCILCNNVCYKVVLQLYVVNWMSVRFCKLCYSVIAV